MTTIITLANVCSAIPWEPGTITADMVVLAEGPVFVTYDTLNLISQIFLSGLALATGADVSFTRAINFQGVINSSVIRPQDLAACISTQAAACEYYYLARMPMSSLIALVESYLVSSICSANATNGNFPQTVGLNLGFFRSTCLTEYVYLCTRKVVGNINCQTWKLVSGDEVVNVVLEPEITKSALFQSMMSNINLTKTDVTLLDAISLFFRSYNGTNLTSSISRSRVFARLVYSPTSGSAIIFFALPTCIFIGLLINIIICFINAKQKDTSDSAGSVISSSEEADKVSWSDPGDSIFPRLDQPLSTSTARTRKDFIRTMAHSFK